MFEKTSRFRPIAGPLDVDDAALDRVNAKLGVPTLTKPVTAEAPAPLPEPVRAPLEKLTVEIPDYLSSGMKQEALNRRTTVRHLVLMALKKDGFRIDDADLVPDGRRTRGKTR